MNYGFLQVRKVKLPIFQHYYGVKQEQPIETTFQFYILFFCHVKSMEDDILL